MREEDYKPTELTADRAVELWKRMLRRPKYDNMGDTGTPEERRSMGMASMLAAISPNNVTDRLLDSFGVELKKRLLDKSLCGHERSCLSVDYGPDRTLSDAAKVAGLKMKFPWKTTMHVHANEISVSYGYGSPYEYHYPLGDGRWLVTCLSGSDIGKVIEYVNGGKPEFKIESVSEGNQ